MKTGFQFETGQYSLATNFAIVRLLFHIYFRVVVLFRNWYILSFPMRYRKLIWPPYDDSPVFVNVTRSAYLKILSDFSSINVGGNDKVKRESEIHTTGWSLKATATPRQQNIHISILCHGKLKRSLWIRWKLVFAYTKSSVTDLVNFSMFLTL